MRVPGDGCAFALSTVMRGLTARIAIFFGERDGLPVIAGNETISCRAQAGDPLSQMDLGLGGNVRNC